MLIHCLLVMLTTSNQQILCLKPPQNRNYFLYIDKTFKNCNHYEKIK